MNLWFNSPHGPFDPAPRDLFSRARRRSRSSRDSTRRTSPTSRSGSASRPGSRLGKRQAKAIADGAPPPAGAADLGRRSGRPAGRGAERQGDPRRHLHRLRLGQRVLPRRAPDRGRQVSAPRSLLQGAAPDPRPRHPGRRDEQRARVARGHPQTDPPDRLGRREPEHRRPLAPSLRTDRPAARPPGSARGRHGTRRAPGGVRTEASAAQARTARVRSPASAGSGTSTRSRTRSSRNRADGTSPGLPGHPHRSLPLRPLRQRAERALRHEARPGPAAVPARRPALPLRPQVALRPARCRSRPAPARRAGSRSDRSPPPLSKNAVRPKRKRRRESKNGPPGYDSPARGTGQTG